MSFDDQKPPLREVGSRRRRYRADVLALVALAVAAAAWPLRETRSAVLGVVLILSLTVVTAGVIAEIDGYPSSNIGVLAVSVSGGILLGRLLPARARPMGVLLAVLALLDTAQLLFFADTVERAFESWVHFMVRAGDDYLLKIGVADLVLVVAMTVHGARRGVHFWPATLPGPVGLVVSTLYTWIMRPAGGLVLVPFLLVGWLAVEGWLLATRRRPL